MELEITKSLMGVGRSLVKIKNFFMFMLTTIIVIMLSGVVSLAQAQPVEKKRSDECKNNNICASTTSAIASSYSTLGYWSLAGILNKLGGVDNGTTPGGSENQTSYFALWGALFYMIAIISAIIMMALGQPPKMYGWFVAGPALFYFLLFNTVERRGVGWDLSHRTTDQKQHAVWKLAAPGINTNPLITGGVDLNFTTNGPSALAKVPFVFALVDDFASETAQNFIELMGVTPELPDSSGASPGDVPDVANWHLLSNSKWELLENISQAKLYSTDIRELLTIFMASECGDLFSNHINKSSFSLASQSSGRGLPPTLFCEPGNPTCHNSVALEELLATTFIPTPYVFRELMKQYQVVFGVDKDIFPNSLMWFSYYQSGAPLIPEDQIFQIGEHSRQSCGHILWKVMQGFRWESALHYYRLKEVIPSITDNAVTDKLIDYVFLYDWLYVDDAGAEQKLTDQNADYREDFIRNLIMFYMIRNEMAVVPQAVDQRVLPSEKTTTFAEGFQRNINSKNKFAEFYTWAKLMPHMQGLVLYILAIGYPLACVVVLIPGWWKWILTWFSFYVWVKSWDVGFAIVMNIEKSIWATIGNSLDTSRINGDIAKFNTGHDVYIDNNCPVLTPWCGDIEVMQVDELTYTGALNLIDKALIISRSLNHDLANSYYIYLMSALYFAVPAITGQVFLGAKAGMSSFVKESIGQVASEGGGAAKAGATADVMQQGNLNTQAAQQTFTGKALRQDPNKLAVRALTAKNDAEDANLQASLMDAHAKQKGFRARAYSMKGNEIKEGVQMSNMAFGAALGYVGAPGGQRDLLGANAGNAGIAGDADNATPTPGTGTQKNSDGQKVDDPTRKARKAAMQRLPQIAKDAMGLNQARQWYQHGVLIPSKHEMSALRGDQQANYAGFHQGAIAKGLGEGSQRLEAKANYGAQEAAYRSQAQFARQIAGQMSALGVVAGAYDPQNKPKDLPMLGAGGQLGGQYDQAYGYFSDDQNSGYMGKAQQHSNALRQKYGNVKEHFEPGSVYFDVGMKGGFDFRQGITNSIGKSETAD